MTAILPDLPVNFQKVLDKFITLSSADNRILSAFIYGSHATGKSDEHSDLDLGLVVEKHSLPAFLDGIEVFIREFGEVLFLDDFDTGQTFLFIITDGSECGITVGNKETITTWINGRPFITLVDKTEFLRHFDGSKVNETEHQEKDNLRQLERILSWFWHDLSHFIAAIGREQIWWALGQLEDLRRMCVQLTLLKKDFSAEINDYEKIDGFIDRKMLSPLEESVCRLDLREMQSVIKIIVQYFTTVGSELAREHQLDYPKRLQEVMLEKLSRVIIS
ncbi:MAG: aminoglycoside 6-adenylyltransferase [Candidatus Hodarchaeota archaeon]